VFGVGRLCPCLASAVFPRLLGDDAAAPDASAQAAAGASAVFLAFGGEEPAAVADMSLRDFLAALAKTGFNGALVVHSRAWAVTNGFKTVLNDTRVADFVKRRAVYVVTLNATHVIISQFNATTGALTPRLYVDRRTGEAVRKIHRRRVPLPEIHRGQGGQRLLVPGLRQDGYCDGHRPSLRGPRRRCLRRLQGQLHEDHSLYSGRRQTPWPGR
jgi:hypothetical protein